MIALKLRLACKLAAQEKAVFSVACYEQVMKVSILNPPNAFLVHIIKSEVSSQP